MLCIRHLRKNVESYLQDKVGVKQGHRVEIVNSIFESGGVIQANDSVVFSDLLTKTRNLCAHVAPGFVEYVNERLSPLLEQQVKGTTKSQSAGAPWTNKNAESANHLLKIATQWKPRSLAELIEKLQGVVAVLYKDVRRAVVGRGMYCLAKEFENCAVLPQTWDEMTQNQKDKAFK